MYSELISLNYLIDNIFQYRPLERQLHKLKDIQKRLLKCCLAVQKKIRFVIYIFLGNVCWMGFKAYILIWTQLGESWLWTYDGLLSTGKQIRNHFKYFQPNGFNEDFLKNRLWWSYSLSALTRRDKTNQKLIHVRTRINRQKLLTYEHIWGQKRKPHRKHRWKLYLCQKKGHGQHIAGFIITFCLLFVPLILQTHLEKNDRIVWEKYFKYLT